MSKIYFLEKDKKKYYFKDILFSSVLSDNSDGCVSYNYNNDMYGLGFYIYNHIPTRKFEYIVMLLFFRDKFKNINLFKDSVFGFKDVDNENITYISYINYSRCKFNYVPYRVYNIDKKISKILSN